jgi:hypothetical protein
MTLVEPVCEQYGAIPWRRALAMFCTTNRLDDRRPANLRIPLQLALYKREGRLRSSASKWCSLCRIFLSSLSSVLCFGHKTLRQSDGRPADLAAVLTVTRAGLKCRAIDSRLRVRLLT